MKTNNINNLISINESYADIENPKIGQKNLSINIF